MFWSGTTALAEADISAYYNDGDRFNKVETDGSGLADINVSSSGVYTIIVSRAGHSFSAFALTIPDTVTWATDSVFQYKDSVSGTDNTTNSSCFATISVGNDFGLTNYQNAMVTATIKKSWNSCTDKWIIFNEEVLGYTNSDGELDIELPRSTCIDDKKIKLYANGEYLGKWIIPDSAITTLTYANRD